MRIDGHRKMKNKKRKMNRGLPRQGVRARGQEKEGSHSVCNKMDVMTAIRDVEAK